MTHFLEQTALSLAAHLEEARAKGLYCALSGGADSVALLLALIDLGIPTTALHCNFHLRGEESDGDELFVRQLCAHHHLPLEVKHFDTQAEAARTGESIEMAARRLRYEWFAEKERPVAVAHHADDNAETLLLNLLRGTGLRGLTGMSADNGRGILRPLLGATRGELLQYLKQKGQDYRTDTSNADTHYRRNAIRHQLLPLLRTLNPSIDHTLTATIDRLQGQCAVYEIGLAQLHEKFAPQHRGSKRLYPLGAIRQAGSAGRTYLFELLAPLGFESAMVDQMFTARTGALFHSSTHTVCIAAEGLEVHPLGEAQPLPQLHIEQCLRPEGFQPSRLPEVATLDSDSLVGALHLRLPRSGERFRPYGLPQGTCLVNDYLAARHLSRLDRQQALVVCDEQGIVWLVGHTIAHRCAITPHTQHITTLRLV